MKKVINDIANKHEGYLNQLLDYNTSLKVLDTPEGCCKHYKAHFNHKNNTIHVLNNASPKETHSALVHALVRNKIKKILTAQVPRTEISAKSPLLDAHKEHKLADRRKLAQHKILRDREGLKALQKSIFNGNWPPEIAINIQKQRALHDNGVFAPVVEQVMKYLMGNIHDSKHTPTSAFALMPDNQDVYEKAKKFLYGR